MLFSLLASLALSLTRAVKAADTATVQITEFDYEFTGGLT